MTKIETVSNNDSKFKKTNIIWIPGGATWLSCILSFKHKLIAFVLSESSFAFPESLFLFGFFWDPDASVFTGFGSRVDLLFRLPHLILTQYRRDSDSANKTGSWSRISETIFSSVSSMLAIFWDKLRRKDTNLLVFFSRSSSNLKKTEFEVVDCAHECSELSLYYDIAQWRTRGPLWDKEYTITTVKNLRKNWVTKDSNGQYFQIQIQ